MTITAAPATAPSQWLRVCVSTSAHPSGSMAAPNQKRRASRRARNAPSDHSSAAAITPPEVIWVENTEARRYSGRFWMRTAKIRKPSMAL